jgi:golgi phosphoprotein 3
MINIFEALFILALDDQDGNIIESVSSKLESVIAGAILVEMVLQRRIEFQDERIVITDQTSMDHSVLDKALYEILYAARTRKLKYWINTFVYQKLLEDISHHLVERGILVRKKKRLRLAVPHDGHSTAGSGSTKYQLIHRLRAIVFTTQLPETSEKLLLGFLYHGELLKLVFTQGERKAAHKRIKKLIDGAEGENEMDKALYEIVIASCR